MRFTTSLFAAIKSAKSVQAHGVTLLFGHRRPARNGEPVIALTHNLEAPGFVDQMVEIDERGQCTALDLAKTPVLITFFMHCPLQEKDINEALLPVF